MVLNPGIIDCVICASFEIITWHESDHGIVNTRIVQLVCKKMGTNRYTPIICLKLFYYTVCVLFMDPDVLRLDFRVNGHVYLRYNPFVRFSR